MDSNGNGAVRAHMCQSLNILEGPYDDKLTWPFLGTVTFCLLNQSADANHHIGVIVFDTTCNARVGNAQGYAKFLSHTRVSTDQNKNIRYLLADTLHFRVTVEVDHHKPWQDIPHRRKP